ncbi:MAG: bifunctional phosphoribosylaminoimidazolecarboxamide formyltransferase/IMP cyclohydrolase [Candidatus Diapherotrites archaeon]|nr:bifunctional phosphoribosylaminoimidazolecarboxamide formyltransferase/IMP cyclohydrolase [Candidatus Diapherotrites archaeon]
MTQKLALISVTDKTGLPELCQALQKQNFSFIGTTGTQKFLEENKLVCNALDSLTGFPELLDGRVKTLNEKIHAGILANRSNPKHLEQLKKMNILPIDCVIVNLYDFKNNPDIEHIDIGGITLMRAAAKNFEHVLVLVDPQDYSKVIQELTEKKEVSFEIRKNLAWKAFALATEYDSLIAGHFSNQLFPEKLSITLSKKMDLRYGENAHQKAAFYSWNEQVFPAIEVLGGKPLSFNNISDMSAAILLACEFSEPTAVIVKHENPCGVSSHINLAQAFQQALDCDSLSAFGGVIALNQKCDFETAQKIAGFFNEVVIAPEFEEKAIQELKKNPNRRIVCLKSKPVYPVRSFKPVFNGLLVQEPDSVQELEQDFSVASEIQPSKAQLIDLMFAWKIAKHCKSNAIVIAKNKTAFGIGCGQQSRVHSTQIAIQKAGNHVQDSVLAGDAFFPFPDSVELAITAGVQAIIAPKGSVNDSKVINTCNEHKISLVFAQNRHFKH